MAKLSTKQYEENSARLSRERQQERLIKEWAHSKNILKLESETAQAIITINGTIKKYPLSDTQLQALLALKKKAQKKHNHRLNIEIFKMCKTIKRMHKKQRRGNSQTLSKTQVEI